MAAAGITEPAGRQAVEAGAALIGRIVRSVDFERVLQVRSRASSPHFAVHHVASRPIGMRRPELLLAAAQPVAFELSTGIPPAVAQCVDDFDSNAAGSAVSGTTGVSIAAAIDGIWFGAVVPKRHARRSVTRSLLKRQIRAAIARQAGLECGLWVVRLRAPFDRNRFPSAASESLRQIARTELDSVLARASTR